MIVLSLFDGIACGLTALKRAGIPVTKYYASEIDKHSIKTAKKNHPDIIHLGDVTLWDFWNIEKPDLIIGGSPCQGFSFAGKQLAFDDPRSKLFFTMMDIIDYYKPKYKLLENVRMKKEYLDIITEYMGVEPIMINSALVSAQNRKRYYWCNWNVTQPEDKEIMLKDIVHEICDTEKPLDYRPRNELNFKYGNEKASALLASMYKGSQSNGQTTVFEALHEFIVPFDQTLKILDKEVARGKVGCFRKDSQANRVYYIHNKAVTLCGDAGGGAAKMGQYLFGCITPDRINKRQNGQRFNDGQKFYTLTAQDRHGVLIEGYIRKLTPIECERLQTLPDNYTDGVSNAQRYKMLGNGWTIDVIEHLFKELD